MVFTVSFVVKCCVHVLYICLHVVFLIAFFSGVSFSYSVLLYWFRSLHVEFGAFAG